LQTSTHPWEVLSLVRLVTACGRNDKLINVFGFALKGQALVVPKKRQI